MTSLAVKSTINLAETCRICLQNSKHLQNLSQNVSSGEPSLLEVLMDIASIQEIDTYNAPTLACNKCIERLKDAYDLRKTIQSSENFLQEYVSQQQGSKFDMNNYVDVKIETDQDFLSSLELKTYKCEFCDKILQTQTNLNRHKMIHSGEKPFVCSVCNKRFMRAHSLKSHFFTHLSKLYGCSECDESFVEQRMLTIHKEEVHAKVTPTEEEKEEEPEKEEDEEESESMEEINDEAKQEEETVNLENVEEYLENESSETVVIRDESEERAPEIERIDLPEYDNETVETVESSSEEQTDASNLYHCQICSKSFAKDGTNFCIHVKSLFGNSNRTYSCKFCDKCFYSKSNLQRHIMVHTGEKPFQCSICKRCFNRNASLKNHMQSRHPKQQSEKSTQKSVVPAPAEVDKDTKTSVDSMSEDDKKPQIQPSKSNQPVQLLLVPAGKDASVSSTGVPTNNSGGDNKQIQFVVLKSRGLGNAPGQTKTIPLKVELNKEPPAATQDQASSDKQIKFMVLRPEPTPEQVPKINESVKDQDQKEQLDQNQTDKKPLKFVVLKQGRSPSGQTQLISLKVNDPPGAATSQKDKNESDDQTTNQNKQIRLVLLKPGATSGSTPQQAQTIPLKVNSDNKDTIKDKSDQTQLGADKQIRFVVLQPGMTQGNATAQAQTIPLKVNSDVNKDGIDKQLQLLVLSPFGKKTPGADQISENTSKTDSIKSESADQKKVFLVVSRLDSSKTAPLLNNNVRKPDSMPTRKRQYISRNDVKPRRYKCVKCEKHCKTPSQLAEHMRSHNGERPYKCEYCCRGFTSKSNLNRHIMLHTGERPFVCSVCKKTFNRAAALRSHFVQHSDKQPFNCLECGAAFSDAKFLIKHQKTHQAPEQGGGQQEKERKKPAEKEPKFFPCTECNKLYKSAYSLRIHMYEHSGTCEHLCTQCGRQFKNPRTFRYHQDTAHTGARPFECSICHKRYKSNSNLHHHMQMHTNTRPYLCPVCGKRMKYPTDMRYHMRTHTKERPYSCNQCDKTFIMSWHLNEHLRKHAGDRRYPCDECDRSFYSKNILSKHKLIHANLRPFACKVCKKSFNSRNTLRVHSYQHTDKRPFYCDICGKGFIHRNSLRVHVKSHRDIEDVKYEILIDNTVPAC